MLRGRGAARGRSRWPAGDVVPPPPAAPVLLAAPAITGQAQQGQTLSAVAAVWDGAVAVQRRWLRAGAPISGATGTTYVQQAADVATVLTLAERAQSAGGTWSEWAPSDNVGPVFAALFGFADDFASGVSGDQVRLRSGWAVWPAGETTVSSKLQLNASGHAAWTATGDTTTPGTCLIGVDVGRRSMEFEFTLRALGAASMWVMFAAQDHANGLRLELQSDGDLHLYKYVGGVATALVSHNGVLLQAGDVIRVEALFAPAESVPSMVTIRRNGTVVGSVYTKSSLAWADVVTGTKVGIPSQAQRGVTDDWKCWAREDFGATVWGARFEGQQAVPVGETAMLTAHLVGLTKNAPNLVRLRLAKAAGLAGLDGIQDFVVNANQDGTAMLELPYTVTAAGAQSLTVTDAVRTLQDQQHGIQFDALTITADAVAEGKVVATLSFSGLPPLVSQRVPVAVVQPVGLAEMDWAQVLVHADAAGNGTAVIGGFAAAAGVQTLQVTACGATRNAACTVTALPALGTMPRMSNPATWGGAIPGAGADVVLPAGYVVWDMSTPAWASLTIPAGATLIDDPAVSNITLNAGWLRLNGGRMLVGRAKAKRTARVTINLTGATPTRTPRSTVALPGQTLNGFIVTDNSRSLINDEGDLVLHGAELAVPHTRLAATAAAGSASLVASQAPGWAEGDDVVVTPTTYHGLSAPEAFTLSSVAGATLGLSGALAYRRWGQLQYATDTGLSLAAGNFAAKKATRHVPTVLDQRAIVANLTRPILITCPDDAHWQNDGHGVTSIVFGRLSADWRTGVEIRRCGQRGVIEHYPTHYHLASYAQTGGDFSVSTGEWLGDAPHMLLRGSVIRESKHRAMTIHATTGVRLVGNIAFGFIGHGLLMEDGSEERNTIHSNLLIGGTAPAAGDAILASDEDAANRGPAALWLTNPQNDVVGNIAIGCIQGVWNAPPDRQIAPVVTITKPAGPTVNSITRAAVEETWTLTVTSSTTASVSGSVSGAQAAATKSVAYDNGVIRFMLGGTLTVGQVITVQVHKAYVAGCTGLSAKVDLFPFYQPQLRWLNNEGSWCKYFGMMSSFGSRDEPGNVAPGRVDPQRDGRPAIDNNSGPNKLPYELSGAVLHGNGAGTAGDTDTGPGNYKNEVCMPGYRRFVAADAVYRDLQGGTQPAVDGNARHFLFVGRSLRLASDAAEIAEQQLYARLAVASYHFTMYVMDSTVLHYPANPTADGIRGNRQLLNFAGFLDTSDLYVHRVEDWTGGITNIRQVDVPLMQRCPPAHIETEAPAWGNNAGGQDAVVGGVLRRWTFAGMFWDPLGIFGGGAVPEWLTWNHPFYTLPLASSRVVAGRTVATQDHHVGVAVYATDLDLDTFTLELASYYELLDASDAPIAAWTLKNSTEALATNILSGFHHVSLRAGSRYRVYDPDNVAPNTTRYALRVDSGNDARSEFVLAVPWSAAVAPKVHMGQGLPSTCVATGTQLSNGQAAAATEVASKALMTATPRSFWRDTAANQVWINFRGGFDRANTVPNPKQDLFIGVTPA